MIFPLMPQTEMSGTAEFQCKRLRTRVSTSKCIDWYVDHNALNRKESSCFGCQQGQENREAFARS
jgi:hypothetical protein